MKKLHLVLIITSSVLFSQATENPLNLETVFKSSSVVVNGKVLAKDGYWDNERKMIYTVHKVKVAKSFKGNISKHIYVLTEGGNVGLEGLIVKPSIDIAKNSSGYFMLKKVEEIKLKDFDFNDNLFVLSSGLVGYFDFDSFHDHVQLPLNQVMTRQSFEKSIKNLSKKKPIYVDGSLEIDSFSQSQTAENVVISSISPTTITAGNSEILTISGSGFGDFTSGANSAYVSFRDADQGGSGWVRCLKTQVMSWSDTEIKVQVPSDSGSGTIRLSFADNSSFETTETIVIPVSINNINYSSSGSADDEIAYPIYHAGSFTVNGEPSSHILEGKYLWSINSDFYNNTQAMDIFEDTLIDWRCTTGINFEISEELTEIDEYSLDYTNVVSFGLTNAIATTYSYFIGCNSSDGIQWTWRDVDIIFNQNQNFGYDNVSSNQIDFNSTSKHELGHAMGFGHNINSQTLMHYATGGGEGPDSLDPYLDGAQIILARNVGTSLCGTETPHAVSACSSIDPNIDTDGDGVNDIFDKCANSPSGSTVDDDGCALSQLDSDNDGVSDDIDQCPTTPEGVTVDSEGCADSDGDGIFDYVDACPNSPSGSTVDDDGCALSQLDSDNDGVTDDFDQCPSTQEGDDVDVYGCTVLLLSQDNFQVSVTANSCIGTNDGSIYVSVKNENLQYQVLIDGQQFGLNSNYGFTRELENLGVGTYSVCFTVNGYEYFEQCFDVVLSQPDPLSVDAREYFGGDNLYLNLSGSSSFNILHNGHLSNAKAGYLNISLSKGLNDVKVFTDYECQGFFEETYFNSEEILVNPNPVNDVVNILVGGDDQEVQFMIRDIRGVTLINSTKKLINNRKVSFDLGDYANGVYFVEVISPTVIQTSKIIKDE